MVVLGDLVSSSRKVNSGSWAVTSFLSFARREAVLNAYRDAARGVVVAFDGTREIKPLGVDLELAAAF
jgi:hypothetical protein